jgi:hypothetical protein
MLNYFIKMHYDKTMIGRFYFFKSGQKAKSSVNHFLIFRRLLLENLVNC